MNEETVRRWCIKADNDFKTGKDELITKKPATDTVCFHMQQCAEKYLKAYLIFKNKELIRTHNIALLLQQCIETDSEFYELQDKGIAVLTSYALITRYPDEFYTPTEKEAELALKLAVEVKNFVHKKLTLNLDFN